MISIQDSKILQKLNLMDINLILKFKPYYYELMTNSGSLKVAVHVTALFAKTNKEYSLKENCTISTAGTTAAYNSSAGSIGEQISEFNELVYGLRFNFEKYSTFNTYGNYPEIHLNEDVIINEVNWEELKNKIMQEIPNTSNKNIFNIASILDIKIF